MNEQQEIIPLPKTYIAQTEEQELEEAASPHTVAQPPSAIRSFLLTKSSGRLADGVFGSVMLVCALSIFCIVLLIVFVLVSSSRLSIHTFGWKFFTGQVWDPVSGDFGAYSFIFGTLATSLLALLLGALYGSTGTATAT